MLIEISQPLNYLSPQISRSFVTQEQSFLVIMVSLTAHTKAISSNMAVGGLVLRHIKTNKRNNNNNTVQQHCCCRNTRTCQRILLESHYFNGNVPAQQLG